MKEIMVRGIGEIPKNFTGHVIIPRKPRNVEYWYKAGKVHRKEGPAEIWGDGSTVWRLNGKPHRVDGPAYEHPDGEKQWFLNGKYHRMDGPAIEYFDGSKHYWIHDEPIHDENAYWLLVNMMKLKNLL